MNANTKIHIPKEAKPAEQSASAREVVHFAYGRYITRTRRTLWDKLTKTEFLSKKKVTRDDVIGFTREFATLLESGLTIGNSLELLAAQRVDEPLGPVIQKVSEDLVAGDTLAEAFSKHPEIFDEGFTRSISSASRGAPIARALYRAADFMSERASVMSEMKRQLAYPVLVLVVGIVIVGVLLTVSLPQMMNLFTNLDSELPTPTRILIAISNGIRGYPEYIALGMLVVVIGTFRFTRTKQGRRLIHLAALKIPGLRKIVLFNEISKMSEVTSSLLESGMPINAAIDAAKDSVGNDIVREAMIEVRDGLQSGDGLAAPLRQTGLFPATFTQSLEVAENTGTLTETLSRLSRLYREEARVNIKSLVGMVQPLSTILVALIVGFIAISVIMPMYTALGQFD